MKKLLLTLLAALLIAAPTFAQSPALSNVAKLNAIRVVTDPAYAGGAKGNGVTDDGAAITAAVNALSAGGTMYFPPGTYAYATSPNFAKANVSITAAPGVIFKHTGTGNAFVVDGGAAGGGVYGMRFDNITVQGNSNSTHGVYVRAVHHSIFNNVRVTGAATTGAAIRSEFALLNQWNSPRVSSNAGTLSPVPLYGMYFTRRGVGEPTNANTITNPVMEGLTGAGGAGLYFDYASYNVVIGGASEGNYNGLVTTVNAGQQPNLTVVGTDFESNSNRDLDLSAAFTTFIDINANGTSIVGADLIKFIGGQVQNLTINNGPQNVVLDGLFVNGTLTDNNTSQQTTYRGVRTTASGTIGDVYEKQPIFSRPLKSVVSANPVTVDTKVSDVFVLTWDASFIGVPVTVSAPTNAVADGQKLTITVKNTTGGALGALTFNAAYKIGAAWVQPANGFNRSITFYKDGSNWREYDRTAADVAN